MLLYLPIFSNGAKPTNAIERRAALIGVAYAPIVISSLLGGIGDVMAGSIRFELFDGAVDAAADTLIYDSAVFTAGRDG